MTGLLTLADFRRTRDQVAVASMLERLSMLEPLCKDLAREYRGLRRLLVAATDRNERDDLEYELYNKPSGEYGDAGGIAWQWARVDAEIGDILNDERYIQHKAKEGTVAA